MTAVLESTDATPAATARTAVAPAKPRPGRAAGAGLGVVVIWISLIVLLPLAVVVGKSFAGGWSGFTSAITASTTADSIELTVGLAVVVAIVNGIMGTLVAWVLVRERFRGAGVFELVIDVPFALPTIVAGLVILLLYGQDSPIGVHLVGSRVGIFVALLFVTLPFTVRTVQPVLHELDLDAEQAAASLGASPVTVFRRIVLPQILPATASGIGLAFARALGEYGSLVLISGGIPGHTLIAPAQIYGLLQNADDPVLAHQQAAAIATVLLVASALVLVIIDVAQRRVARRG